MPTQSYHRAFEEDWAQLKANIQFAASYKEKWPKLVPLFEQISEQNAVFIMIWNMMTNRIIYTVDKRKVSGYDSSSYLAEDGVYFSMSKMHPDFVDSVIIQQQEAIQYFLKKENGNQEKTIANLEGVYKKYTDEYFHFLQQSVCVETDGNGQPFLFLTYVHDISYIKKNRTANLVISTPQEVKLFNFNFDKNCVEPVQPISKQEKKILNCLAEGKSSKDIAKELFISPLTVDKHRRNLLKKTNCLDTSGMITYTKLVGLL